MFLIGIAKKLSCLFVLQLGNPLANGSEVKGTVSPDYKCLKVISIKSPLLGHVTPDI
jgi:hypothetical protein